MGFSDACIIAGLIFVNGFFVAAEFALVKVRTSQIDQLAEQGNWAAKLTSRALDHLDAYLSASQLGITVASLALGYEIEKVVKPFEHLLTRMGIEAHWVVGALPMSAGGLLAFSLVTFLHMALGEQAPKSLAIRSAKTLALWTAPVLIAFYYLFFPLIWTLNKASLLTLWVLGLSKTDHDEVAHTEEELRHIVAESVGGGHLSRRERVMIENVLNLEEKTARRIMVPRPDVVYLSLARSVEDNLRTVRQAGHTRYPLCEDDLTTVIGIDPRQGPFPRDRRQQRPAGPPKDRAQGPVPARDAPPRPAPARIPARPRPPRDAARRVRQRGRDGHARKRARGARRTDPGRVRSRAAAGDRPGRRRLRGRRGVARSTSWPSRAAWPCPRPRPRRPAAWCSTSSAALAAPAIPWPSTDID